MRVPMQSVTQLFFIQLIEFLLPYQIRVPYVETKENEQQMLLWHCLV